MDSVKLSAKNLSSDQNDTLKKVAKKGFENFHANLHNSGKDDTAQQKVSRMAAIKRRMSKS